MLEYNEERDRDGLGGLTIAKVLEDRQKLFFGVVYLTGKLTVSLPLTA